MNLAIFGATGGTGRQLVEQALEKGHTVTVLVRNPAHFPCSMSVSLSFKAMYVTEPAPRLLWLDKTLF